MALAKLLKLIEDGTSFRIRPETLNGLKELEGGAEAVGKLQSDFNLSALKSGELFAERKVIDSAIDAARTEVATTSGTIDQLSNFFGKHMQGELPPGDSPITHALNTSSIISGVALPQQMLAQWKKVHQAADIINAKLSPTQFDLLPTTTNWDKQTIKSGVWHLFSNPKYAFDQLSKDLVTKPTELKYTADKYGKHARGIWKTLTKGMKKDEMSDLNRVLAASNDAEEVFTPTFNGLKTAAGEIFEVSDAVQEAYFGTRMLMDHMYWLNNTAAVRQANSRGFKLLKSSDEASRLVKEIKGRAGQSYARFKTVAGAEPEYVKWHPDLYKDGYRVVEMLGKEGKQVHVVLSESEVAARLSDVPEMYDMIGYRKGYVPVIYKDQWAVNRVAKLKDGTYRAARVSTAPTRVKANKAVGELHSSHALADDEVEQLFIAARKNDSSTDVAYGENLHNILDSLSRSELDSMKAALLKLGLDKDIVDSLEQTGRFFSHKRNPYMMKRGMRLKDWTGQGTADILPADEAIQKYLQSSASYASNADYIGKLEQQYLDEFGELLTDTHDFQSPFRAARSMVSSNGRTTLEANLVRSQIQRVAGTMSNTDRIMENFITTTLDKFATTNIGKAFDNILDKMSDTWGLNRLVGPVSLTQGLAKVKGFTATAKLGLWNISQAVVQGTAALNVIGKNPIMAARATKDVVQALGPEIMKIGKTAEGSRLYKLIDDSGFIAGFDYVELQRIAAKGTDKLFGSRALRKVCTNLIPYHLGEGGVRALAWFTEYRILSQQIARGVETVAQDSPRMLQMVNEAASITALNMSRVNQPLLARGILGVPFQFKQFLVQQAEFLFGAKNFRNRGEQLGVWAAWVGAFGIQGMPWVYDVGIAVDSGLEWGAERLEELGIDVASPKMVGISRRAIQENSDAIARFLADNDMAKTVTKAIGKKRYDDARAFWDRMINQGSLSAITDGEWNIASRASLARVFTEYYGTQKVDDYLFGPGYQTAVMLIHNNIDSVGSLIEMWRNDEAFTAQYLLGNAARATRGLPGLQHPLQAAETYLTGQWKDTERRLIENEPTLTQILMLGTGFSPAQRAERFERIEFTQKQKDAWKEWLRGRQDRIARLSYEGNTKYATALLDDTLKQIAEVNPLLGREFMMSYSQEMIRRGLSEDAREVLYRMQDAQIYDSSYDKFFFGRDTYIGWGDR